MREEARMKKATGESTKSGASAIASSDCSFLCFDLVLDLWSVTSSVLSTFRYKVPNTAAR